MSEQDTAGESALPPELTSLIHHVELHRSGWWDRSLERLVLVIAWLESPTTRANLIVSVSKLFDGRVSRDRVDAEIGRQLASGAILEFGQSLKVNESVSSALESERLQVEGSKDRLHDRLVGLVAAAGLDADPQAIWDDFIALFLTPLARQAGARMYEVLASGSQLDESIPSYQSIVEPICQRYGPELRPLLIEFLDPSDRDIRELILRELNSNFLREAAGLESSVLDKLRDARDRPERVRVFLDTNFLFSFLELHDNPANETAEDLIQVLTQARAYLPIDLYVLPITVEETRRVLQGIISRLTGVAASRNLAMAGRTLTSTGLVTKYLESASKAAGMTAQEFFGTYESGLVSILAERGVRLFNEDMSSLTMDQGVIDDIHDLSDRQSHRPAGSKSYESNLHDAAMWRFAARKRPPLAESPLDLGYWVCTLDFGLINFDRGKSRRARKPPVCISPGSLIQLIQFWAPKSDEFDKALANSFREPLLYLDFDSSTEKATIDIMKSLSRFENVGDLAPTTVLRVLSNDALRSRLENDRTLTDEQQMELVEAAVIDEAHRLEEQVKELKAAREKEAEQSAKSTEERDSAISELAESLESQRAATENLNRELESTRIELQEEAQRRSEAEYQRQADEQLARERLEALELQRLRESERNRVMALGCAGALALVAAVAVSHNLLDGHVAGWFAWTAPIAVALSLEGIVILLAMRSCTSFGRNHIQLVARVVYLYCSAIFVSVGLSIFANVATDALNPDRGPAGKDPITTTTEP